MNYHKYKRGYFMPDPITYDWVHKEYIDKPPIWCSVDLRDGNQALVNPMCLEDKLKFFKLLVEIGFREIEIGFPAASDTEYDFLRTLIDQNLIPDDVTIQVLTQARPHIIAKTFEALKGVKKAVVHIYNSTSYAQRVQVFKKSKEEIIKLAVDGAKLVADMSRDVDSDITFEYSPESFTGTEPDFALEVINSVLDVWQPTPEHKVIINLPVTVEMSLPHIYASQVEYIIKNMRYRESVLVSLHPHNDRGTAVADTELGLLAGADRVEGTLFGNGERTGNVDIVTLAMNMYSHGVDSGLNFENMGAITAMYENVTGMNVSQRQPYAGELVFAAFSGSHQDAIAKGMDYRGAHEDGCWEVPYLPIDPMDVGKEYSADVIRINSQSGKGGVSYVLDKSYGYKVPINMREELGRRVKNESDILHRELSNAEVYDTFAKTYVNRQDILQLVDYSFQKAVDGYNVMLDIINNGQKLHLTNIGNGVLDSVSNAIKEGLGLDYRLTNYMEHSKEQGSNSEAISYVSIQIVDKVYWGVGEHEDISSSSIKALLSAVNRYLISE